MGSLVVVVVLFAAACGGSSSDDATVVTTAGTDGTSGSAGAADVQVGGGFDGSVEACAELSAAFASLAIGPSIGFLAGDDGVAELRAELSGRTLRVPAVLEDPFAVLEEAYASLDAALGGLDFTDAISDPAALERFEQASSAFNTPAVQQALGEVEAFLEDNCTDFSAGDFVD